MRSIRLRALLVCAVFSILAVALSAAISIPTGSAYLQNLDGLGIPATATTASTLPADFRVDNPSTVRTVASFATALTATARAGGASLSTTAANGIYNFGAGTATLGNADRAVGFLSSGTATASGNLYAQLVNNTGAALTGLQLSYNVEKYRGGTNAAGYRIQLFYSNDGSNWTSAGGTFTTSFGADAGNNGFATAPGATVPVSAALTVPIANGATFYLAWNYSVSSGSTTTNGQALAVDDISITGVGGGGNNPSATMTANPASVVTNDSTLLTVTVTGGTAPYGVTGNLTQIGGAAAQTFTDAGGGQFTFAATVPPSVTSGQKTVTASVSDANGGTAQAQASLNVTQLVPTPPTGSGSASPSSVPPGGTTQLTVNVTPGTNPASSGLTVTGDLSAIGGSATQPFSLVSGNTFSVSATVAVGTTFGSKSLSVTVSDAEGRSSVFGLPLIVTPPGAGTVIINEIDADTPGSDTAEFIELYDGGAGNTPLDGLVVVLYDGGLNPFNGNQSYAAFDLDGYTTDANGYFVLGNPGVANAGIIFDPGQFGLLQNGPDAVALYVGNAGDFSSGTVVTTANLLDAIVYGTNDPNPSNLMTLINAGQLIVNEDANGAGQTESSQRCPNGMGGIRTSSAYRQSAPTPGAGNTCAAPAFSDVVISQIYGGGGNTSATYHNDFVELYNKGASTVDLSGWSIQYASSTGSGWDTNLQPIGGTIGSHEYYLIALGAGANAAPALPPANIVGQINMSGTAGKVALTDSFDPLIGNCPIANAHLKDFVGYGTADCGEGATTAPSLSGNNTLALLRLNGGETDTNNNHNDFATGSPNPRRTAPIVELGPFVLLTDPRRNATTAPRDATIQITFTEAVDLIDPWFDINCAATGHHTDATFAGAGKDHYITPNVNFQTGEQCTVTIFKNQVHDQDLDDAGPNDDTLQANYVWSFTVATGTAPPFPASVHLTLGNPSGAVASIGQPNNYLMEKPEFALSYNRDLGRPNWVSWHLSDDWIGTLTRVDTFRPDPEVPSDWYRVQSFDFSGSGFDRGHMTPNADRDKETSIPINQATFLMSNMVAQAPDNNQGPWATFENYLRTLTGDTVSPSEIYIVAGPVGIGGTGDNGSFNTIADGHVTVPAYTWKVALVLPKDDGGNDLSRVSCSTRTIAVLMRNINLVRTSPWEDYLTTVDAVEALTGYNLFSSLPEPIQNCVEAGINGNNPPLVKGNQTITFDAPPDHTYGDAPFVVSATGGASGNPVTFVASGVCTSGGFGGSVITIGSAGTCTITASQAGSDIYNPAPDVVRTLTVNKAAPAFASLSSPTIEVGTPATSIGGTIAANGVVPPGSVSITLGATTVTVPIGPAGQFSASFATAALGTAGSPYALTFSYAGNANFEAASGSSSLQVVDSLPPAIGPVSATPNKLGPPNHKMIDVFVAFTASDASGPPVCSVAVSSNEPPNGTGDGNTTTDWIVIDAHHVQLRAERAGGGSGRIYTLTVTCADASGHSSSNATTVIVPK
jgi:endonuclease G